MATAAERTTTKYSSPDPSRNAWQVPLFRRRRGVRLGLAGLAAAGHARPGGRLHRDLAVATQLVRKGHTDRDELKDLLAKVATGVDSFPEQASMARFTLGSGYAACGADGEPRRGPRALDAANNTSDLIRSEDLKDPSDPPRLAFRSAKARAAVGLPANTPPAEVRLQIALLGNAPFGEERATRPATGLLRDEDDAAGPGHREGVTDALPDCHRYRHTAGFCSPGQSIYLAIFTSAAKNQTSPGSGWSRSAPTRQPMSLHPRVSLLARVRGGRRSAWRDARPGCRAGKSLDRAFARRPPRITLVCKLNTREWDAAANGFQEALRAEPPENIAAAIRLADLTLRAAGSGEDARRPICFANAVKGITDAKEFRNPLIRVSEVRGTFEFAISTLLTDAAFESAIKVTDAYKAVSEAGRDREKRAEILAAWAAALQKAGEDFKPKALAAAAEYQSLVEAQPAATAKAEMLRRAASLYKLGGNANSAVTLLQDATKLPQLPDATIGPVWRNWPTRSSRPTSPRPTCSRRSTKRWPQPELFPRRRATGSPANSLMAATRDSPRSRANCSGRSHNKMMLPRLSKSYTNGPLLNWLTTSFAPPTSRRRRCGCASNWASTRTGRKRRSAGSYSAFA